MHVERSHVQQLHLLAGTMNNGVTHYHRSGVDAQNGNTGGRWGSGRHDNWIATIAFQTFAICDKAAIESKQYFACRKKARDCRNTEK
jgi:hypothetical protein